MGKFEQKNKKTDNIKDTMATEATEEITLDDVVAEFKEPEVTEEAKAPAVTEEPQKSKKTKKAKKAEKISAFLFATSFVGLPLFPIAYAIESFNSSTFTLNS